MKNLGRWLGAAWLLIASAICFGAAPPDLRLIDAVKKTDVKAVRSLIAQRLDVNAADVDGSTALHWAAQRNNSEIVDLQSRKPIAENTVVFPRGSPFRLPQSGHIRLAIQAWCGSSQVRLAVFRARGPRIWIGQPLCMRVRESSDKHDSDERALIAHNRAMLTLVAQRSQVR